MKPLIIVICSLLQIFTLLTKNSTHTTNCKHSIITLLFCQLFQIENIYLTISCYTTTQQNSQIRKQL